MFTITWLHPLDVIKTRLQISKKGSKDSNYFSLVNSLIKDEGIGAFYKGINAAWFGEAIYYGI